jgi:ABC-type phosphate transport system substrate-binding protein
MRKRKFLLVAGACLASLSLAVGSAMADPSGAPTFRNLAGSGSDTTQGVMNALSQVITIGSPAVKQIGSYDAGTPTTPTMSTKSDAACTNIPRPSGSNNGIIALVNSRNAGNHCLQFARSSSDNHTSHVSDNLTYIPFATDSVAYAIRGPGPSGGSSINRNLTVANLLKIYTCDPAFAATTQPLLPQFGSGTRKFFLENILHVPGGDTSNYVATHVNPNTSQPCVKDTDSNNNPLLENTGNLLTNDLQIEPYSVSSFIAQTTKNVLDVHGFALLGNIEGNPSLAINATASGVRPVFNVLPNKLVADGPNSKAVFVGPNSLVCQNTATLLKQGFATNSNCGDTSIQSNAGNGADTVGAGE